MPLLNVFNVGKATSYHVKATKHRTDFIMQKNKRKQNLEKCTESYNIMPSSVTLSSHFKAVNIRGNSELLPSDVIVFAMLPAYGLLLAVM